MMKKPELMHGFALKEAREIKEIKATAYYYEHVKSGAQLVHLKCEDNNKVFCIAFKTVPEDDTGCPHILEHSVLNGSKNFPGKSTFQELIKGSLHTFINAMTASDMTLYPVASTNDQDFLNLTKVYLDAVFNPMIYQQPHILHQEGWHYELPEAGEDLKIRGVVYNEMKGAFSSPDSVMSRYCQHAQFPDTPYGFESGGDPEAIPELTYEKFIAFHQKYYHPDNSFTFIYGDMDADKVLELMDKDYLSSYKKAAGVAQIPLQKAFDKVQKLEHEYTVEEGKDISNQYHLGLCWTYGRQPDNVTSAALSVLMQILMHTPASPLKRVIMESGLAKDSTGSASSELLQPTLTITCKQVAKANLQKLHKLIEAELKRLVKEGIDKRLIEGVLNSLEFTLREAQMNWGPKGLYYAWSAYPLWMHGGEPLEALGFEDLLKELRRGLKEPYFEHLLEKALVKNKHASVITFVPVPGLANKRDQELAVKLAQVKKGMKKPELAKLVKFTEEFKVWQAEEVDPADLAKIPMLRLEDIDRKSQSYPLEKAECEGIRLLKHELNTNGIIYLKAYFDLSHALEEDLPWLALYTWLTGMMDSKNFSYAELSKEIDIHTGGVGLGLSFLTDYQDPDIIMPKFAMTGKAVSAKAQKLVELAAEYAMRPKFEDIARLKTVVREAKAKMEAKLLRGGVTVAINRMFAPFSRIHHFNDLTQGLGFYHFLTGLDKMLENDIEHVTEGLAWVRGTFFNRRNLILSVTADKKGIEAVCKHLPAIMKDISDKELEITEEHFHTRDFNEGILAPVQIQYCAKGGNFFRKGYSYSGHLRVMNSVISNDFLHKEIREKGGAYGAFSNFSLAGNMYFCSYMDPNLRETLETYDRVPEFLRNFDCSKREMDKYIIGDVSSLDYPKTPEGKGAQADEDFIAGFTQEDRQQIRNEVLSTKIEDIRSHAKMIEEIMSKNHFCVFGNEVRLREAEDLFDKLTPVFE
jgi:presequence protease